MKKILFLLTVLVGFASCVKNDPYVPPKSSEFKDVLFINEVNGWPADAEKNVEFYNSGNTPISLENFVLDYGGKETWKGREGDVVPAKGYKVITGAKTSYPGMSTGLSARNPNVNLTIFDTNGGIVDRYEKKPDLIGTPLEVMCHMRVPDGGTWYYVQPTAATPGAANIANAGDPSVVEKMPPMDGASLEVTLESIEPAAPTPADDVTIIVKVVDENTISSVLLKWKKDGIDQTDVNITSTKVGTNYTTIIAAQAEGTEINWTIEATNSKGTKASTSGTFTFATPAADYTKLKINEVSGVGADGEKFYELINTGSVDINLAGCQIYYNANGATGGTVPTGDGDKTWEGTASQVIGTGANKLFSLVGKGVDFTKGLTAGRILVITLKDPNGNVLDQCIRAEDTGEYAFTDKSFSRIPDGTGPYYFTIPTLNTTNGTVTTGLTLVPQSQIDYASIVINEIDGNKKFIELYNKSAAAVNISGMKIYKNRKDDETGGEWLIQVPATPATTWAVPANTMLPANAYFVIPMGGSDVSTAVASATCIISSVIVNNGISTKQNLKIQLYAPDGTTVIDSFVRKGTTGDYGDAITPDYSKTTPGIYSFARTPDGTGSFNLTVTSPGLSNTASQGVIVSD